MAMNNAADNSQPPPMNNRNSPRLEDSSILLLSFRSRLADQLQWGIDYTFLAAPLSRSRSARSDFWTGWTDTPIHT